MPPEITEEELKAFKAAKEERDALKAAAEKNKKPSPKGKEEDEEDEEDETDEDDVDESEDEQDLRTKAAKGKQSASERAAESKRVENALKFNLSAQDFVKQNADVLPSEIADILKVAEKETYDSAVEKAGAVKSAFIQSFFSVQANLDALTAAQKTQLDDYLKLTKNGREQKAPVIYENIFEPALETLKKIKKAEEVGKARAGFGSANTVLDNYKQRLISSAKKAHLGEKGA